MPDTGTTERRFRQVDVFTDEPLLGNPVAVVLDADGLRDDQMAALARWTNLSETTFVLPVTEPTAHYRLRIFTPGGELPFAGHPTIGSAHAVLEAGLVERAERLVQECAAGLIELSVADDRITFLAPPAVVTDTPVDTSQLAALLGGVEVVDPRVIDVGPRWLTARVVDGAAMDDVVVDQAGLAEMSRHAGITGLTIYRIGPDGAVELRSFAPADGVPEDPVCGSGNAVVGVHVATFGQVARTGASYTATQGRFVKRDGRIHVTIDGDRVSVGGHAVTVIAGTLAVPDTGAGS